MLSIEPDVQNKVKAAASILKKAPFLKLPMCAAKFLAAQSSNNQYEFVMPSPGQVYTDGRMG